MTPLVANFHGIGEIPPGTPPSERPFWLTKEQFEEALQRLDDSGRHYVVTFDDGNLSDVDVGVPSCARRNLETFVFACTGRIGLAEYLDRESLRDLSQVPRCIIGSHGRMHIPWRGLGKEQLIQEVHISKYELEGITGSKVDATGLPFGAYDRGVLQAVKLAGYRLPFSSDGGPRLSRRGVCPRTSMRGDRSVAKQVRELLSSTEPIAVAFQEIRVVAKSVRPG